MKAIRMHQFGGPEVLRYEDTERPEPQAGQVLVRARAIGVNALDWKLRQGLLRGFMDFPLPLIPGCDVAGTVEAVGPGVSSFAPGDRVFGMAAAEVGMYAEYALMQAGEIEHLPEGIPFPESASLPTVAQTAWQALFEAGQLREKQRVLIHGSAGGVGSMAVQLAKWTGAYVVATASTAKLEFVKSLGADEVIDYKTAQFEDGATSMDLVLDVLSGETRQRSWKTLRSGGTLVSTVPPFPTDQDGRAAGAHGKGIAVHPDSEALSKIAGLVLAGKIKTTVDRVIPLENAAEAHRLMQAGKVQGKLVLAA